jgi:RNA polymerase sigma factor (sigma-70 family)
MRDESEAVLDALMGRLAEGDRSAFEPLFRALHPRAVRFARSRLRAEAAADAAQSALLKVFANASRFVPGRPALPWFYAIVANEIRALHRQGAREVIGSVTPEFADERTHEDELLERELLRALDRAIAGLDEGSARAIRAQLGHEIRPEVESPTFRKRVSRAYARLRLLLGER